MFYVYAHFKADTKELFYIGVGKTKRRFKTKFSRNPFWKNVVDKHGFYYEILHTFDYKEDCLKKEMELIAHYGRRDLGTGILVNLTAGGEGLLEFSDYTRKKLSETHKTKVDKTFLKGRTLTEEHKSNISAGLKKAGRVGSWKGKKMPDSVREAMRISARRGLSSTEIDIAKAFYTQGISLRKIADLLDTNHKIIGRYVR